MEEQITDLSLALDADGHELNEFGFYWLAREDESDERFYCVVRGESGQFYFASVDITGDPKSDMIVVPVSAAESRNYVVATDGDGYPLSGKSDCATERYQGLLKTL